MTPPFLGIPAERMNEIEDALKRTILAASNEPHFQTLMIDLLENFTQAEAFAMGGMFMLICNAAKTKITKIPAGLNPEAFLGPSAS